MAHQRTKQADPPAGRGGQRGRKGFPGKTSKKAKQAKPAKKVLKVPTVRTPKSPRRIEAGLAQVAGPSAVKELDRACLARITALAQSVFGDRDKAERWLGKSKRALDGNTPLSYLTDKAGEQTIQDMLYQIDDGVIC
jgi:Protein of unknown function (DUF2384)